MTLAAVVDLLRCPRCAESVALEGRVLRCCHGHAFDIAKQGYANLTGAPQPAHADTAAMVSARGELLGSGRYGAVADALVTAVPRQARELLDVGTGTGHYAAAVLGCRPDARALGLDISVAACRRAGRAHPRLGVITGDVWRQLPVADGCLDAVLSVFSPRNLDEFARVLRPDGMVITVTPDRDHLAELREEFGLLTVEKGKGDRLADAFRRVGMITIDEAIVRRSAPWTLDDAVRSILMGPNAFHVDAVEVRAAAAERDWPRTVTLACVIGRWRSDRSR